MVFYDNIIQVIVASRRPDILIGKRQISVLGFRDFRFIRIYDRTVRIKNSFIRISVNAEEDIFIAGVSTVFYAINHSTTLCCKRDKAGLLTFIILIPFFIGVNKTLFCIYGIVKIIFTTFKAVGNNKITDGIPCRKLGGKVTFIILKKKLYPLVRFQRSILFTIIIITTWLLPCVFFWIRYITCNRSIREDNDFRHSTGSIRTFIGLIIIVSHYVLIPAGFS